LSVPVPGNYQQGVNTVYLMLEKGEMRRIFVCM